MFTRKSLGWTESACTNHSLYVTEDTHCRKPCLKLRLVRWLDLFNAVLSPKRYWREPRSQQWGAGEEGDYTKGYIHCGSVCSLRYSLNATYTITIPNATYTITIPSTTYTITIPNATYTITIPNATYTKATLHCHCT